MSRAPARRGYLAAAETGLGFAVFLLMLVVGCTPESASDLEVAYEQKVQQMNRSYNEALATLTSPSSEKEAREPARLAAATAEQMRALDPPSVYAQGHDLLIEFYERSEEFFSLGVEIDLQRRAGADTAQLDQRQVRQATELLELWQRVIEALPFLEGTAAPEITPVD